MKSFQFKCPSNIIFGAEESLSVYKLIENAGKQYVLVLTGKHVAVTKGFQSFLLSLKEHHIKHTVISNTMPEPDVKSIDEIAGNARKKEYDCVVSVGGGSVLDTGKAISMLKTNPGSARDYMFGGTRVITEKPLLHICIPTTAGSGSEVTASSVISDNENQTKVSITSQEIIPDFAVIDPMMQAEMPMSITASTGMDALTHGIESFISKHANPISDMYAKTAIKLIGGNIRKAVFCPEDLEARGNMALASTLAAAAFMNGGLGAVHGISQSIGGIAHVSHGIGNALLLPYVMEVNRKGNQEKFAQIAELLGENIESLNLYDSALKAVEAVNHLIEDLKIPKHLKDVGVEKDMFQDIIKATMEYRLLWQNPVPVYENIVKQILEKAYE